MELQAPADLRLETAFATDVGQVRELNEDTVWVSTFDGANPNPWSLSGLLLVADGMGGHLAGEVASGLAGETVRALFTSPQVQIAPDQLQGQALLGRLSEAVSHVNARVWQHGEESGAAGAARPGTTLTLALLRSDEWMVGHVGDSRAYLVRRGGVEQITQDDSLVAEAVRRGQMSAEEARESPFRNQITQAIGLRPEVEPSTYYGHWIAGDVLVLCSDGLSEYLTSAEIGQSFEGGEDLQRACDALVEKANARGGHDNISVAAARFARPLRASTPLNGEAHKPVTWPPVNAMGTSEIAAKHSTQEPLGDAVLETPSNLLRRNLIAVVLCALAALAGLFWGYGWGQTSRRSTKSASRDEVIAAPAPQSKETKPLSSTSASIHSQNQSAVRDNPIVPEFSVALSQGREAFVLTAKGLDLKVFPSRDSNPVERLSGNKWAVRLSNYAATQQALQNGDAELRCLRASSDIVLTDAAPKSGVVRLVRPRPGDYLLRYLPAGDAAPREMARFSLSIPSSSPR